MKYHDFLDMKISIIGFGGIPIMSGRDSEFLVKLKNIEYQKSLDVIEEAYQRGINFFDTALDYGDSEEKLGIVLSKYRKHVFIASKSKALDYDQMMRDVDTSLKRLQTDYINLYQFHYVKDPYSYEKIMGKNGAFCALRKLKEEKVIKHIGVASHNSFVLEKSINNPELATIQLPYNIIENNSLDLIHKAKDLGKKTIIMKPYAGGSLTSLNDKTKPYVKNNNELRTLALKFILDSPADIAIPGVSSKEELFENLEIALNFSVLTQKEKDIINNIRNVIGRVFCRRCQYCEPCPQGVPISKILRYEKYYDDYNLKEWAQKQYSFLSIKADHCIECHKCESKCPYMLNICSALKRSHSKLNQIL